MSGAVGLSDFVGGPPRQAMVSALWQQFTSSDAGTRDEAAWALGFWAKDLAEPAREAVVDSLLAAAADPPKSFRKWNSLSWMRDYIPISRAPMVFAAGAQDLVTRRSQAGQQIMQLLGALLPGLFKTAPDWTMDWLLYLYGDSPPYMDANQIRQYLRDVRPLVPPDAVQRLISAMEGHAEKRPSRNDTFRETSWRLEALGVLASYHESLTAERRKWVEEMIVAEMLKDGANSIFWLAFALQDMVESISPQSASKILEGSLEIGEKVGRNSRQVNDQAFAALARRIAPTDAARVKGRLEALASGTNDPRAAEWARECLAAWPG